MSDTKSCYFSNNQNAIDGTNQFIKKRIKDRYIDKELKPLKCDCGSTDFVNINEYFDPFSNEEFTRECKNCGQTLGHWAFNFWQV